jgi:hypothetical protein
MSKQVQGSEGERALRRPSGPSARPENDRKTTGFTKPPVPELNFGIEKVKKRYGFGCSINHLHQLDLCLVRKSKTR